MSKIVKPLLFAMSAVFATVTWMPAQAADAAPMARETHADVKKDKADAHKDVASLRAAMRDRAKDRRALAAARRAHNKAKIAKAEADLKADNMKIRTLRKDLRKDRKDMHKAARHHVVKAHKKAEK